MSYQDVFKALNSIHIHPDFERLNFYIHDFGDIRASCVLDASDIDVLLAHVLGARYTNPEIDIAIVAEDANIARVASEFVGRAKFRINTFVNLEAAKHWLSRAGA